MQKSRQTDREAVAVAVLLPAGFVASANFNSGHAPHCWQSLLWRVASSLTFVLFEASGWRICPNPFVGALFVAGATGLGTRYYYGGKEGNGIAAKNCFRD